MFTMEFHAADGGADAEAFASELASSVSKYAGLTQMQTGRVVTLVADRRL